MGLLNRHILREVAVPSVMALCLIIFLGVGNELRERMDDLPIEHLTLWDLGRLTLFIAPSLVNIVIPITYMMGILLAFGRLTQNNEITAMKAAGVPLKRLVVPVVVGGALLSVGCFFLQDRVQPYSLKRAFDIVYNELPRRLAIDVLPAGVMHEIGDWRVYIGGKDPETNTLNDIEIYQPGKGGSERILYAESATMQRYGDHTELTLTDCTTLFPQDDGSLLLTRSPHTTIAAPSPSGKAVASNRRMRTLVECLADEKQLQEDLRTGDLKTQDWTKDNLRKMRWEISERLSLPLFALVVSMLATPLAARIRYGGRSYSFAIGCGILLVYFPLKMALEPHSLHSLGSVIARGMVPNIVMFAAGAWALRRVDNI